MLFYGRGTPVVFVKKTQVLSPKMECLVETSLITTCPPRPGTPLQIHGVGLEIISAPLQLKPFPFKRNTLFENLFETCQMVNCEHLQFLV